MTIGPRNERFLTRDDTIRAVEPHKIAKVLKCQIKEVGGLYLLLNI